MASLGFIGLGNMGSPMAVNLVRAGHRLRVHDLAAARTAAMAAQGADVAAGAIEAASGADAVITMLPAGAQVAEIYLGSGGLIEAAAPRTPLIDCSTIAGAPPPPGAAAARRRGA